MSTITITGHRNQEKIAAYLPRPHWTAEDAKARKRNKKPANKSGLRIAELNFEYTNRYGRAVLPDDDGGREDVWIMLNHLAFARHPRARIVNWLKWRAPWFDDDALVEDIIRRPRTFTADALAKLIGLTFARRTALGLTIIGSIDMPKKKREELRKAKEVARRRESRRAAGAVPRAEKEQTSIERQKPWIAMGCSRRTWFRKHHVKPSEAQRVANVVPFGTAVTGSNSSISYESSQCSAKPQIASAVVAIRCM